MGTLVFVVLKYLGMIDTPYDILVICFLISLDSIGLPALINMIRGDY